MCKNVAVEIMTKIYAFKVTFLQNGKQWLKIIQDKSKLKITLKCHFFKNIIYQYVYCSLRQKHNITLNKRSVQSKVNYFFRLKYPGILKPKVSFQ